MHPSLLIALLLTAPSPAGLERLPSGRAVDAREGGGVLVRTGFEEGEDLATGPDRFRTIELGEGSVDVVGDLRWTGHRSARLQDRLKDGCFPELLAFFDEQSRGTVSAFASG